MDYALAQFDLFLELTGLRWIAFLLPVFVLCSWLVGRKFFSDPAKPFRTIKWSAISGLIVGTGIAYIQFSLDMLGRIDPFEYQKLDNQTFFLRYFFIYVFYSICVGHLAYFSVRSNKHVLRYSFPALSIVILMMAISPVIPYLQEETWRADARKAYELAAKHNFDEANAALDKLLEDLKPSGGWQPEGLPLSTSVSNLDATLQQIMGFYLTGKRNADVEKLLDKLVEVRRKSDSGGSLRFDAFLNTAGNYYRVNKNIEKALACFKTLDERNDPKSTDRDFSTTFAFSRVADILTESGRFDELESLFLSKKSLAEYYHRKALEDYITWCLKNNHRQRALQLISKIATKLYKGQSGELTDEDAGQADIEEVLVKAAKDFLSITDKNEKETNDYPSAVKICMIITSKYKNITPDNDNSLEEALKILGRCALADASLKPQVESVFSELLANPKLASYMQDKFREIREKFLHNANPENKNNDSWD